MPVWEKKVIKHITKYLKSYRRQRWNKQQLKYDEHKKKHGAEILLNQQRNTHSAWIPKYHMPAPSTAVYRHYKLPKEPWKWWKKKRKMRNFQNFQIDLSNPDLIWFLFLKCYYVKSWEVTKSGARMASSQKVPVFKGEDHPWWHHMHQVWSLWFCSLQHWNYCSRCEWAPPPVCNSQ